jgi:hypothetical protein
MIPIVTRLKQMFTAKNTQSGSVLQDFLFGKIIDIIENPEDIIWDISPESSAAKEFIDECYSYLTRARVKTEHKVLFTNTKTSIADLHRSDEFYMKGIIENRDFIFTNNN